MIREKFDEDGTPPHSTFAVREYFNETIFGECKGRKESVEEPAMWPDLSLLLFEGYITAIYKNSTSNSELLKIWTSETSPNKTSNAAWNQESIFFNICNFLLWSPEWVEVIILKIWAKYFQSTKYCSFYIHWHALYNL